MDYALKYGISADEAAAQLQAYNKLRTSGRVFMDRDAYMESVFGNKKKASGDPVVEETTEEAAVPTKQFMTRTLSLTPAVPDDSEAEEATAKKVGLLRGVFSRVGKSKDDGSPSKFAPPFDLDAVKKAVGQFQTTVVPRAKQAVDTVSPYIQEGARQAVVFAKPILAKGAEFGGEAAKQVLEFVTKTLLPQILEVVTSTLTQLLSALVSALFSAIGSAVKSAIIGDALGDPEKISSPHLVLRNDGVFYSALAKLFESADMEDMIRGRKVGPFGNDIFYVADASQETVKNLRGALWMFVHVKQWVTADQFDQIFMSELLRRYLRTMVFGEPGSPMPYRSGDPIPAGDLQSALLRVINERRKSIEIPPDERDDEPSPFDEEDDAPPPLFAVSTPKAPASKPSPAMSTEAATAIYQSPPVPPPLPPRDPVPAPPAPASTVRVGPNAQTWNEIKAEFAQYLDPRTWPAGVDYVVSPPWSVQNVDTLIADPSIPEDPALLSLAARARSFYKTNEEDQALRRQALKVLAGDKAADPASARTLEKLTSGFLDDPAMIANMTAYYNTAMQTNTFSTSVLENIIKDTQRQGLKAAGLDLTDQQIDELVASYSPQTKTAVQRLLSMLLRPVDTAPVTASVRPEVSMTIAQVADTMAPYIPSSVQKTPFASSGVGGFGARISNLIAQTGGAFGKVTTDLLSSPEIRGVVSDVTRVATETASQAIVDAGKGAIASATRTRTPEEIMEADRLRREAASARAAVEAQKKADREAQAALKKAEMDAKKAKTAEEAKAKKKALEATRLQRKAAEDARRQAAKAEADRKALQRKKEAEEKAAKRKADADVKAKSKMTRTAAPAKTKTKPSSSVSSKPKAPKTKPAAKPKTTKPAKTKTTTTRTTSKIGAGMTEQEINMSMRGDLVVDFDEDNGDRSMVLWTKQRAGDHAFSYDSDSDSDSDSDDDDDGGVSSATLHLAYSRGGPVRVVQPRLFDALAVPRSILSAYKDPAFHSIVNGEKGVYENGPFVVWNPAGAPMPELREAVDTYVDGMASGLHVGSPFDALLSRKKAASSGEGASLRAWATQTSPEDNQPGSAGVAAVVSSFMATARDPKSKLMPTDIAARVKTAVYMLLLALERLSTLEKPGGAKFAEKFPLLNNGLELFASVTEMASVDMTREPSGFLFGKKDAEKDADPSTADVLGKNVGLFLFALADEIVKSGMQDRYYDLADEAVRAALGSKGTVDDKGLQRALRLMNLFSATAQGFLVEPDFARAAEDGVVHVLVSPVSMLDADAKGDIVRARLQQRAQIGDLLEEGAYQVAMAHGKSVAGGMMFDDITAPSVHVFVPEDAPRRLLFRNNRRYRKDATVISGHRSYGLSSIPHHRLLSGGCVEHATHGDGGKLQMGLEFDVDCNSPLRRTFSYQNMKMARVGGVAVFVNRQ